MILKYLRARLLAIVYQHRDRATARILRRWIDQQAPPKLAMNLKHTPGPWRAGTSSSGGAYVEHHNGIGLVELADVAAPDGLDCAEANARLMAAAPELLAAVEDALWLLEGLAQGMAHEMDVRRIERELKAALAKSRGEELPPC